MLPKLLKPVSWLAIFGLVIVTLVPADERPVTGLRHALEHFLAFGLTGMIFGLAYARRLPAVLLSYYFSLESRRQSRSHRKAGLLPQNSTQSQSKGP
jgi:hypothetical protein